MSDNITNTNHVNINIVKVLDYHTYIYRYHTGPQRMSVEHMYTHLLLQGCIHLFTDVKDRVIVHT